MLRYCSDGVSDGVSDGYHGCIVFCRKFELHEAREAGNTGTQAQYCALALELPQTMRIAIIRQVLAPVGYDPVRFNGGWPLGGVVIVKGRVPATYHAWRQEINFRTGLRSH